MRIATGLPPEGRAPHARRNGIGLTRACLPCALGSSFTPGNHDMPWLASGLTSGTRRPRPSEKIAFRVVPRSSPLGRPYRAGPPRRGGLCTPVNEALLPPVDRPSRPPAYHQRTGANDMPRLAYGLATRTHGVRPSEKTAPGVIPGFPPQGHPGSDDQSGGGAGSARPLGRLRLDRGMCPLGHRAFVCPR